MVNTTRRWATGRRLAAVGLLAVLAAGAASGQRGGVFRESRDHPAIRYTDGERNDAVTALNEALQSGGVELAFDSTSGYLRSLLDALDVPVESQVTVFSETSFQARWVTPESPRAIYFNDTVAVGWVKDADVLEIASLDPVQGVGFWSLDQQPAERPELTRNEQCLACHLSWDTLGVPGLMTLNTLPLPDDPNAYAVGWVTDHRSPLEDRWGSWYVTGAPPALRHLGNRTEPFEYIPGGGDSRAGAGHARRRRRPRRLPHPVQRPRGPDGARAPQPHDQPAGAARAGRPASTLTRARGAGGRPAAGAPPRSRRRRSSWSTICSSWTRRRCRRASRARRATPRSTRR